MVGIIKAHTVGYVATVRPDDSPAVSPKATLLILDECTIAFPNIRSHGTVENLRPRADIEVDFVDVFRRKGCRVRGLGRCVSMAEAGRPAQVRFKQGWPDLYRLMTGIVVIAVMAAEIVTSPSYDVGAVPDRLTKHWLRRHAAMLGFEVTRRSRVPCAPLPGC